MNYKELETIRETYKNKIGAEKISNDGQVFIATRNCGRINPEEIGEYIATGGYFELCNILTNKEPKYVLDEIAKSGLRGRGGAGFPTAKKWQYALNSPGEEKYFICNGDEGDPGAFMDRCIIEEDPHSIVEAMILGGFVIGASLGIVYIRAEYPLACKRIEKAINDAKNLGILGTNIFGSKFSFDIIIKKGAGAFVCGEETALIKSCEGKRGEPVKKPPYPASQGYKNKPTVINNIETLANIPVIMQKSGDWFSNFGTATSKGTKVFALSGKVQKTGLFEFEMGTTIRQILYGAGGGPLEGHTFKAVQMGGPSGGCIPEKYFDTEIDYESLKALGAMMGSGGMVVMDDSTCMVDIAKFFLTFSVDESCGKCTPCRIGNKVLLDTLEKICQGEGEMADIQSLKETSEYVINNSLCGLGQSSPNPILSTLSYFEEEYIEHIKQKHCRANVCSKLKKYEIEQEKCKKCGICSRVCPVGAVKIEEDKSYLIDQEKCIKCSQCFAKCPFKAIRSEL